MDFDAGFDSVDDDLDSVAGLDSLAGFDDESLDALPFVAGAAGVDTESESVGVLFLA